MITAILSPIYTPEFSTLAPVWASAMAVLAAVSVRKTIFAKAVSSYSYLSYLGRFLRASLLGIRLR